MGRLGRSLRRAAAGKFLYRFVTSVTIASLLFGYGGGAGSTLLETPRAQAQQAQSTATPTPTATSTATATASATPTSVATATAAASATPTSTATPTATAAATATASPTEVTPTGTGTAVPTIAATPTPSMTPALPSTATPIHATESVTVTASPTSSPTASPTPSPSATPPGPKGPSEELKPIDAPLPLLPKPAEGVMIAVEKGGVAHSADGGASVTVGARALGEDARVAVKRVAAYSLPNTRRLIGGVYDFSATQGRSGAGIKAFSKGVTISLTYRLEELGGTPESSLGIYYLNERNATWEAVSSKVDRKGHVVTAVVNHFSQYSIQGAPVDPSQPSFGSPANYGFDTPGHTLVGGPDNAGFDTAGYIVPGGPENAGFDVSGYPSSVQPTNPEFETRDLTGWTLTGSGGVRADSGGYDASYYGYVSQNSSITSDLITLSGDSQTIEFWANSNWDAYYELLRDSDGSVLQSAYLNTSGTWRQYSRNVSSYRGIPVRLRFRSWTASQLKVDRIQIRNSLPGWETNADQPSIATDGGPFGPYAKGISYGKSITSSSFTIPNGAQTVRFWMRGSATVYVDLLRASDGQKLRGVTVWPGTSWASYSFNVTDPAYQGIDVKLRFSADGASSEFYLDNVEFVTNIPGWETNADQPSIANEGGPFGSYAKGVGYGKSITSSSFTIPSGAQTVRFWMSGSGGVVYVDLLRASDGQSLRSVKYWPGNWAQFSFNVSDPTYQGVNVKLKFTADASNPWFYLDQVEVDSSGLLLGENPNCSTCGDPVNMTTGNFLYTHDDLSIPGRGLGLSLSRSHNSISTLLGPLGKGWTFNYGISLSFNSDNSITVVYPDGRQVSYTRNVNGSYSAPKGIYDTLVKNGDGTHTVTTKNQTKLNFSSDGKLTSITDKNGNTIGFSYSGGVLRTVADLSGRTLTFSYGAAGESQVLATPTAVLAFPNADFEQGSYANWTVGGTAFGTKPTNAGDAGKQGTYYAGSYQGTGTDTAIGTLTSVPFTAGRQLLFRYNGGTDAANLKVSLLLSDDSEVLTYTNNANTLELRSVAWDTTAWEGQQVRIRVTDNGTASWGHQGIDEVRVVYAPSGTTAAALGNGILPFANSNFEDRSYLNWFATGTAFGVRPVTNNDAGREGLYYTNSYDPTASDAATGTLTSAYFTAGKSVSFRINGGNKPGTAYIALVLSDGSEVLKTTHSANTKTLDPITWDTTPYEGQAVRIRLLDSDTTSWGWVGIDNVTILYGSNLIQQVTDPAGRTVHYTYDSSSNLVSYTDELDGVITYEYGPYGMIRATDQNGHILMDNGYDVRGRVVEQLDALGNLTTFSYDPVARTTTYTDQLGHTHVTTFDGSGRTVFSQDELGNVESYSYDSAGNRDSVTDKNGAVTRYQYDAMGNITSVTDPLGGVTHTVYDAKNNPLTKTDALNRTTQYQYDAAGNLTLITDAASGQTVLAYDSFGQLISTTDARGYTTSYTYDTAGNRTAITDPAGNTTLFSYDADGRLSTQTDPLNHTTSYQYRADGKVTRITDALNHWTDYAYDRVGNRTAVTDVAGHTTLYSYDEKDRLTCVTDPKGGTVSYSYDSLGNKTSQKDQLNQITTYVYDARNKLTSETSPAGTTSYAYDKVGNLTAVTDATGKTSTHSYDAGGRRISTTDPLGKLTQYQYDLVGNRTLVTDATNRSVASVYDSLNRLVEERDDLSHSNGFAYDATGNRTSVTDPNGNTTAYDYDGLGRLTRVTDAAGGVVTYEYDAVGNKTAMVDANQHRTSYSYDEMNRLRTETDPENRTTTTAYDDLASRVTITRPDNTTVTKQLDELGRTASIVYPDQTVSYVYDAASQLRSMTDRTGTTSYSYDDAGRVTGVTSPSGTLGYGYDAAGRRTRIDYPGSRSVTYGYDGAGRLSTVTDWTSKQVVYGYDDAGRKQTQTDPNGTSSSYFYDGAGRLANVTHLGPSGTIASFSYTPDAAGNPLTVEEQMSLVPGGTSTYTYDNLSRLRSVTYPDATWASYSYDPMGNRTELADQNGVTSYAYDRSDRLLSTSGQQSLTFGWDVRGNQTAKGTQSFGSDQANHLTSANTGSQSASYSYNGEGTRVGKTVGGTATSYLQDLVGGLPRVLVESTGGQDAVYVYGLGLAFEVRPDGTHRYYHSDALGSTRVVTDDAGNPVSAYNYDGYGSIRAQAGEGGSFTFTGEQLDTETSMVFLRARYYDPQAGRFLQRDSFEGRPTDPRTLNRYGYAGGNPLRYVDPTGNDIESLEDIPYEISRGLEAAMEFIAGGAHAGSDALTLGLTSLTRRSHPDSEAYQLGRAFMDVASTLGGVKGATSGACGTATTPIGQTFAVAGASSSLERAFRTASGATGFADLYQFYAKLPAEFQGRRVHQIGIDWETKDNWGMTNLERARVGQAPIGNDGLPINLHHLLQEEPGPMAEVLASVHRRGQEVLHGLVQQGDGFRNTLNLEKQFNAFRTAYWKWRASQVGAP